MTDAPPPATIVQTRPLGFRIVSLRDAPAAAACLHEANAKGVRRRQLGACCSTGTCCCCMRTCLLVCSVDRLLGSRHRAAEWLRPLQGAPLLPALECCSVVQLAPAGTRGRRWVQAEGGRWVPSSAATQPSAAASPPHVQGERRATRLQREWVHLHECEVAVCEHLL